MATQIFVNLPVKDLEKSKNFFVSLGFSINPQFTDETAASIVISDSIFAMIMTHEKYKTFTNKPIGDASKTSQVILALGVESAAEVNRIADAALKHGGKEVKPPQDYGWMQLRTFEDLDGHHWEVAYVDMSKMPQ